MYELINGTPMPIREYNGQRVLTLGDIDGAHQRAEGTARRNFNANRQYFIEGVDFFKIQPYEIRTVGITSPNGCIVVTLSGYLMVSKSFTDELSWSVQRMLVTYFTEQVQGNIYSDLLRRQNELERRLEAIECAKEIRHKNAEYVLKKVEQAEGETITKSELLRKCQSLKAKEITEALEILDGMQIISYRKIKSKRGKPKEIVERR